MRTRFLVPVIWGWAMLVLSCNGDGSHRLARFQQAVAAAPCPLWPEDFLRPQGLPSCPFPAGPGSELPCAVAMHLGTDSEPRLVRHFEFDQSGQLQAYSDHLLGRVADVRVFNYDKTGDHLEIQQAVQLCEHVAPRPLHTTHLHYSANGLLQGLSTQWVRSASITYEFTPHWYGDEARVLIGQHAIELSRQGYGATFYDHNTLTATVETHSRGAQLHRVLWRDPNGALQAHAIYDYNAAGRLKSLKVRYPQGPDHTYHFKYECTAVRARCVPFNQRPQDTPVYGGLLAHDPQLTHFEARSCSDQQSYGGRLCGRIWLPENALTARCCNTDPAAIQLEVHSPFAGARIDHVVLRWNDGHLYSTHCRNGARLSDCRFERSAIKNLPATDGQLLLFTVDGDVTDTMSLDLGALAAAAQ